MKDKHIRLVLQDDGYDVFSPREGQSWGYRYGPSIMRHPDGKLEAWFASPGAQSQESCPEWETDKAEKTWYSSPRVQNEADWFTYRHSEDDGKTWSDEVVVLHPTADSMDYFSVCDPGVICFGGYYYIGYTSTLFMDGGGVCNNGFVARSQNPDGPYYKWTGTGWGEERATVDEQGKAVTLRWMGRPAPILYYDEPWEYWGAGEFSFVKVGKTLYLYYTWTSKNRDGDSYSQTRVATADLTAGDNWPATIRQQGVAIERPATNCDSCDVIYVEEAEKFVCLCTDKRFTPDSLLAVYESDDGLRFTRVNELRTHVGIKCHNCGLAGGPEHRVSLRDELVVGYAYGDQWGYWGTRFHKAHLELVDAPDFSDAANPSADFPVRACPRPTKLWPIHLTTFPHFYECRLGDAPFEVNLQWLDTCYDQHSCKDLPIEIFNYDTAIVKFEGLCCTPKAPGFTYAKATWQGAVVEFLVYVLPKDAPARRAQHRLVSFKPMQAEYTLSIAEKQCKQVRGMARFDDNSWYEICRTLDGVSCRDYDESLLKVGEDCRITDRGTAGTTSLTVQCQDQSFTVLVHVIP